MRSAFFQFFLILCSFDQYSDLKKYAYLFEAVSIDFYIYNKEIIPKSFELMLIQSDVSLIETIANWTNKTTDEILINNTSLQDVVKSFNSVTFFHYSIEDFIQNYKLNYISIVVIEKKIKIVINYNVLLYFLNYFILESS